jgi:low affinity Fe/Cu permease
MKTSHRSSSNERTNDKLDQLSSQIAIESRGDAFGKFATTASGWLGSKWAFVVAILVIAIWAITGPLFHYSDTWQLVINTGTTIVTFLMVFLIQNTQNRDARAINLKLNELIRATDAAGDQMMDIESLSDEELDVMHAKYERIRAECVERQQRGKSPKKMNANRSQDEVSR